MAEPLSVRDVDAHLSDLVTFRDGPASPASLGVLSEQIDRALDQRLALMAPVDLGGGLTAYRRDA